MSARRSRPVHLAVAVPVLACLLGLLSACGSDEPAAGDDPSSEPSASSGSDPTPSAEPSEPGTTEQTDPPETTETTETTEPPSGGGSSGFAALLVADDALPGLNDSFTWTQEATRPRELAPPTWVCQAASLQAYGATRTLVRSWSGPGRTSATQVVAKLADARSATRAYGALLGNARTCAEQLAARSLQPVQPPKPLTPVKVPGATAAWGVVFSGPVPRKPNDAFIDGVTVVQVGSMVSVLSMSSVGQDYSYPPGETPPELAAPIVAQTLAGRG